MRGQVLKDCNYWYYLNNEWNNDKKQYVLKDCNYWYYLNKRAVMRVALFSS